MDCRARQERPSKGETGYTGPGSGFTGNTGTTGPTGVTGPSRALPVVVSDALLSSSPEESELVGQLPPVLVTSTDQCVVVAGTLQISYGNPRITNTAIILFM